MNISIIFPRLANGGGAYQVIHLARELERLGHLVSIHCYYTPDRKFAREWLRGLSVVDCGVAELSTPHRDNQIVGLGRYIWDLICMSRRLAESVRKQQVDVINPHEWPAQLAAVWAKKNGVKAPVVWMCNDIWHIPGEEETKEKRVLFRWFNRGIMMWLERWISSWIDMTLVLSNKTEDVVRKFYQTKKVKVIRSGVAVMEYQHLPDREEAKEKLQMKEWSWLCLAVFNKHRRFEDVINAFELVEKQTSQPMKLYIVGSKACDSEYARKIQKMVEAKHLENKVILVTDYISQQEKLTYLAAADGFISSNVQQTWGLAVVEAMACGLPCIVSTGAGVHEIISSGENGFVYRERDVMDLVIHMQQMMADPTKTKIMAETARKMVLRQYSWQNFAAKMETVFTKAIGEMQ